MHYRWGGGGEEISSRIDIIKIFNNHYASQVDLPINQILNLSQMKLMHLNLLRNNLILQLLILCNWKKLNILKLKCPLKINILLAMMTYQSQSIM